MILLHPITIVKNKNLLLMKKFFINNASETNSFLIMRSEANSFNNASEASSKKVSADIEV